ncbi:MAG: LUD domain-containing protein [Anaerolineales bacterium]
MPYTEDIPTLTNTARKVLREIFLTADVGITGANFAIADEGVDLPRHQRVATDAW